MVEWLYYSRHIVKRKIWRSTMKRKTYSSEFKRQAINLVLIEGQPVKFVSKKLDVHENTLYRWISEHEKFGEQAFPGKGSSNFVSQSKIKKLEKENKLLKEELELLKKFRVFLKQNQK